jgi:heme-degrading monooxygenase HmoA
LSFWETEEALELYRSSELFRSTWAKTKLLFDEKPQANSYSSIEILN